VLLHLVSRRPVFSSRELSLALLFSSCSRLRAAPFESLGRLEGAPPVVCFHDRWSPTVVPGTYLRWWTGVLALGTPVQWMALEPVPTRLVAASMGPSSRPATTVPHRVATSPVHYIASDPRQNNRLGFAPLRDPWPYFCLFRLLCVSKWGLLFDERGVLIIIGHSPSTREWICWLSCSLSRSLSLNLYYFAASFHIGGWMLYATVALHRRPFAAHCASNPRMHCGRARHPVPGWTSRWYWRRTP
jgi:hypothetical protein